MKQTQKRPMTLDGLIVYLEDLMKMGFVSKNYKNEKAYYKLTDLGIRSGLKDLPTTKSQKLNSKGKT
jgi:predicted transcriptional regulator